MPYLSRAFRTTLAVIVVTAGALLASACRDDNTIFFSRHPGEVFSITWCNSF